MSQARMEPPGQVPARRSTRWGGVVVDVRVFAVLPLLLALVVLIGVPLGAVLPFPERAAAVVVVGHMVVIVGMHNLRVCVSSGATLPSVCCVMGVRLVPAPGVGVADGAWSVPRGVASTGSTGLLCAAVLHARGSGNTSASGGRTTSTLHKSCLFMGSGVHRSGLGQGRAAPAVGRAARIRPRCGHDGGTRHGPLGAEPRRPPQDLTRFHPTRRLHRVRRY
jgi:hypothetical protein